MPLYLVIFLLHKNITNSANIKSATIGKRIADGIIGFITEALPKTSVVLIILLPITLPIAMPYLFLMDAVMDELSSGKDVPIATIVMAIMTSDIPNNSAIPTADAINNSAPKIIPVTPNTVKIKLLNKFPSDF